VETLQPLPDERKCFRMVNGVLVERTVKDVLPALKTNSDALRQLLDKLLKEYKSKQDEMDNWKVCVHTISPTGCWLMRMVSLQKRNNVQVVQNQ
jgi:Prefoldin subunit